MPPLLKRGKGVLSLSNIAILSVKKFAHQPDGILFGRGEVTFRWQNVSKDNKWGLFLVHKAPLYTYACLIVLLCID